jgi:recombination protein RecT
LEQEEMTTALQPIDQLRNTLQAQQNELARVLGNNISADKFTRVALTTVHNNPKLLEADKRTLFSALHACAQDGLMPDGREAVLVPFRNKNTGQSEVKYMPGVVGFCKRARNSGDIGTIGTGVVYSNDEFEEWTDEKGPHFSHKKARGDRGERESVYAYAITKDGFLYFELMTAKEVEAAKAKSKSPHIWNGPFGDEMWRKTPLRRLCKYRLPSSSDMTNMLKADAEEYAEQEPVPEQTESTPADPETSSRLSDAVANAQDTPI